MNLAETRFIGYNSWIGSWNIIKLEWQRKTKERTIFIMPWGTFSYKMMLFGLRNVGALKSGSVCR
jgi:hypothetical protein